MSVDVTVVGAGMAGATCARALADAGREVLVLDKGRSIGGRLAQRRMADAVFDHGAQYMAVRDPELLQRVARWRQDGVVAAWPARGAVERDAEVVIGTPSMAAPVKSLLAGITVRTRTRVARVSYETGTWHLFTGDGSQLGHAATLVLAIPAQQAADLLGADELATRLRERVTYAPCLSAMVAFREPLPLDVDILDDRAADLAWAARNGSKPGREASLDAWTLHGSPGWSRRHLEDDPDRSAAALLRLLEARVGTLPPVASLSGHRWRCALVEKALGEDAVWEPSRRLGVCGEWCIAGRIEAAFQSGRAMAAAVLGR